MQNCSTSLGERKDADLVREAQQGSSEAFGELVRRHHWPMLYVACRILKRQEDAEDAVQSAFFSAFRHLSAFRSESSFKTWLTTITMNHARMRRRELTRAARLFSEEPVETVALRAEAPAPDAEESLGQTELLQALDREIRRLPASQRQVMLLHVQSYSSAELAASLDLSLAAAKARLFRARARLLTRMGIYRPRGEATA